MSQYLSPREKDMMITVFVLALIGCIFMSFSCIRYVPVPVPTPTITPSPVPTIPTLTPTSAPTPTPMATRIDDVTCLFMYGPDKTKDQIYKYVRNAILKYKSDHPERFLVGNRLAPQFWDAYYFEVVNTLNSSGFVKAVVDDCGGAGICGEIAVKPADVERGQGKHYQFHILVSSGDLRYNPDSYRATCIPAGF